MPGIPLTYNSETMHGFEYQFAGHLMMHGMVQKGLQIVKAVRDRYDGIRRNPYNEMECGSNYARSMASYALLNALSGFSFDIPNREIGFAPAVKTRPFQCFWSLDSGWGTVRFEQNQVVLAVLYGQLELQCLVLPPRCRVQKAALGKKSIACKQSKRRVVLDQAVMVAPENGLTLQLHQK